jgi:hypothetical protein
MGKEFSITPREVPHVDTKYRRIATQLPHPDSLPTLEKLRQYEPMSMRGQLPVVWERAEDKPAGLRRLNAICDNWIDHVAHSPFPGGCFMCTVATEWDAREGELHDEIRDSWRLWLRVLAREAAAARDQGELPADTDPQQVAFEVNAIAMALNQSLQLFEDKRAPARARAAVRRILGPR